MEIIWTPAPRHNLHLVHEGEPPVRPNVMFPDPTDIDPVVMVIFKENELRWAALGLDEMPSA